MYSFDLQFNLQSHSSVVKENEASQAMLRFLQVLLGLSVTQLLVEVGHGEVAAANCK